MCRYFRHIWITCEKKQCLLIEGDFSLCDYFLKETSGNTQLSFFLNYLCYTSCLSSLQFPSCLSESPSLDVSSTWANMSAIRASSSRFRTLYTSSSCFLWPKHYLHQYPTHTFIIWNIILCIIQKAEIPDILICDDEGLTERLSRVEPDSRVLLHSGGQLARDGSRTGVKGTGNRWQQGLICASRAYTFSDVWNIIKLIHFSSIYWLKPLFDYFILEKKNRF